MKGIKKWGGKEKRKEREIRLITKTVTKIGKEINKGNITGKGVIRIKGRLIRQTKIIGTFDEKGKEERWIKM